MADVIERLRVAHEDVTLQPILLSTTETDRLLAFDGARAYFTQFTDPGEPDLQAPNAPAPLVLSMRYGYKDIGRAFWRRSFMEGQHLYECNMLLARASTCDINSGCYVDCCHGLLTFFEIMADEWDGSEINPLQTTLINSALAAFTKLASRLDNMPPASVKRLAGTGWGESVVPFGGLSKYTLDAFPGLLNVICENNNRAHVFLFGAGNEIVEAFADVDDVQEYTREWSAKTKAYFGVDAL
jgi:hypothetical protein